MSSATFQFHSSCSRTYFYSLVKLTLPVVVMYENIQQSFVELVNAYTHTYIATCIQTKTYKQTYIHTFMHTNKQQIYIHLNFISLVGAWRACAPGRARIPVHLSRHCASKFPGAGLGTHRRTGHSSQQVV